jgi:predicted transcriptional regulator
MIALICFVLTLFASPFKSKSRLEAENAALRHQVIVLQRRVSGRVHAVSMVSIGPQGHHDHRRLGHMRASESWK